MPGAWNPCLEAGSRAAEARPPAPARRSAVGCRCGARGSWLNGTAGVGGQVFGDRAVARAHDAQPADAAVPLGQVGLLLDQVEALGVAHPKPVADAVTVGERVGLDRLDAFDDVSRVEPGTEHGHDVVGSVGLPHPARGHPPEVDLRMQQSADRLPVLRCHAAGEGSCEGVRHAPECDSGTVRWEARGGYQHVGHQSGRAEATRTCTPGTDQLPIRRRLGNRPASTPGCRNRPEEPQDVPGQGADREGSALGSAAPRGPRGDLARRRARCTVYLPGVCRLPRVDPGRARVLTQPAPRCFSPELRGAAARPPAASRAYRSLTPGCPSPLPAARWWGFGASAASSGPRRSLPGRAAQPRGRVPPNFRRGRPPPPDETPPRTQLFTAGPPHAGHSPCACMHRGAGRRATAEPSTSTWRTRGCIQVATASAPPRLAGWLAAGRHRRRAARGRPGPSRRDRRGAWRRCTSSSAGSTRAARPRRCPVLRCAPSS